MAAFAATMSVAALPTAKVQLKASSLKGQAVRAAAPCKAVKLARAVTCSAEPKQLGTAIAAAAVAAAVGFGSVDAAYADISGLTPCSESKQFAKRQKNELKALNKRLKNYEEGSAPALALHATMERTEKRFANYAKAGLLCGTDGLPHLISDPGLALRYGHAGEVFIPTIGFLYVAGWIGHVGRSYLNLVKGDKKPTEKEIIIDVPTAIRLAGAGAGWPLQVLNEIRQGTLLEKDSKITVSPR